MGDKDVGTIIGCDTCKFRLIINRRLFQCAADPYGWAYVYDLDDNITMPDNCKRYIQGKPLYVGKELPSSEFWEVAGNRISAKDWKYIRRSNEYGQRKCKCG